MADEQNLSMLMKKAEFNIKGQSLIEILVSLGIFTLVVSAVFTLFFGGRTLSSDSSAVEAGLEYAQEGVEAVRSIKERDWAELTDGAHGLVFLSGDWYFASGTTDTRGIYTRSVFISTIAIDTKKASTTITWQTDPVRPQKVELEEQLTNWKEALDLGGDTGGGGPTGDWQNPQTLGTIDLGPGNEGRDLDVLNKYVFMVADSASTAKADFYVINAVNGQSPSLVSNINTGPGLNVVDKAGDYAYVGSTDTANQLQIIDLTNYNNPTVITNYALPDVSGAGAVGNSIFYYAGKVYIGTKNASGPEFNIIDVATPSNPVLLGSREISKDVNAIYVSANYAYLATSDDSKELQVFDISDPASIILAGSYNAVGSGDGKSLTVVGNKLYLGRVDDGSNDDFYILDISNIGSIASLGSKNLATDLNDFRVRDSLGFFGASDSNKEFQVWNVGTPSNIVFWSSFNFPQVANAIDYEDNIVYVAVRSNDALRIITSQ